VDTETEFSPNTSVFPCQYHPTNAPYSFDLLASTLHNLNNKAALLKKNTTFFYSLSGRPKENVIQVPKYRNKLTKGIPSQYTKYRICTFQALATQHQRPLHAGFPVGNKTEDGALFPKNPDRSRRDGKNAGDTFTQ